jgi:RNA polymerase sigma factor (sigma-70 family)
LSIHPRLVDRCYRQSACERWHVSKDRFAGALEAGVERAFAGERPDDRQVERYLNALHLEDLALGCACADGDEGAWEYFVLEQRPHLYRVADALEPGGGARDLADSLYAELFGLHERDGRRRSLLRYYHGRSSLRTWLRAVLAQRHVDRFRATRRMAPLPDEDSPHALAAPSETADLDRPRYLGMMRHALASALATLAARDRLRLACYYAQGLTLAQTGRVLGEHEATVSRQLTRTRRLLRDDVERELRVEKHLTDAEVAQCFASATEDAGAFDLQADLQAIVDVGADRKESAPDRSK